MMSTILTRTAIQAAVAVAVFAAVPAAAASVTVGTNSGGNCYPFGCNDSGAPGDRFQQLYGSAAFSGPITINSISFRLNSAGNPVQLKSGTFSLSLSTYTGAVGSLDPNNFNGNLGGDNTLIYSGLLSSAFDGTRLTFVGASFAYDPGAGNLLLDVSVSGGASLGYVTFFDADYTGSPLLQRVSNYEIPSTNDASGLVTTFGAVPEPSSWAMLIAGFGLTGAAMRRRRTTVTA